MRASDLIRFKQTGQTITMLTAWDAMSASLVEDAGADVVTGGSAVFLYLSCDDVNDPTHEPVGGWAKVAIHELQHVHASP